MICRQIAMQNTHSSKDWRPAYGKLVCLCSQFGKVFLGCHQRNPVFENTGAPGR